MGRRAILHDFVMDSLPHIRVPFRQWDYRGTDSGNANTVYNHKSCSILLSLHPPAAVWPIRTDLRSALLHLCADYDLISDVLFHGAAGHDNCLHNFLSEGEWTPIFCRRVIVCRGRLFRERNSATLSIGALVPLWVLCAAPLGFAPVRNTFRGGV